jgi:hypothetical protein
MAAIITALTVAAESRPNNHHELTAGLLRALHDLVF